MATHSSILAMDRGAWWATVHWVIENQIQLSDKISTTTTKKYYLYSLIVMKIVFATQIKFSCLLLLSHVWLFVTPIYCNMPGFPVHHQLPELTHTHVHWVGDAIQPFHPLSSLSPRTLSHSQHQGLFKWVTPSRQGQNIGVSASTSVLPMNIQAWSPLGWTGWISSQSKRLSRVFSNTTVQKHHFFGPHLSL